MRKAGLVLSLILLTACSNVPEGTSSGGDQGGGGNLPTDTPVPLVTFSPIKLSGTGSKVPRFKIPEGDAAIATISNRGAENFVVTSLAADGTDNDLLVNTIGAYSGTDLFDANAGEHSVAFRVMSDGSWSITIKPISGATAWNPAKRITGHGDNVLRVVPPVSGLKTFTVTHNGSENFIVTDYTADSGDIVVNEIGKFSGEETLPDGTLLVEVRADGTWAITPS